MQRCRVHSHFRVRGTGECVGGKKVAISNMSQALHHQDLRAVTGLKD